MSYLLFLREDLNAIPLLKKEMPLSDILSYLFVQGNMVVKASDSSAKVNKGIAG